MNGGPFSLRKSIMRKLISLIIILSVALPHAVHAMEKKEDIDNKPTPNALQIKNRLVAQEIRRETLKAIFCSAVCIAAVTSILGSK